MATFQPMSKINRCVSGVFVLCMWLSNVNALRLPHFQLTKQDIVTIQIKTNDRHKRSADIFPFDIEANFSSSNGISNINLHRIDNVIDDVPVVLNHAGKLRSYRVIDPQKVAYYEDRTQEAVFMVWERPMAGDGSGAQSFDFVRIVIYICLVPYRSNVCALCACVSVRLHTFLDPAIT
ncbi:hypothetical protein DPMN_191276 [Dreissena polymorpha]|uniref:Uncharacterized protein n=1 Tax=Dreissena polymorpha TaxID=45954 RepID=A0A9D3XZ41_DREPO|nr:hypothetical protein DPMN_191276 [Dreissena polymorpha]